MQSSTCALQCPNRLSPFHRSLIPAQRMRVHGTHDGLTGDSDAGLCGPSLADGAERDGSLLAAVILDC
jgi:hypothetical protein